MRVLGSITNRIFLATALLAMLSIGAAVYFVSARHRRNRSRAARRRDRSRVARRRAAAHAARQHLAEGPADRRPAQVQGGRGDRRSADAAADRRRLSTASGRRSSDCRRPQRRAAGARRRSCRQAAADRRRPLPKATRRRPFGCTRRGVLEVVSVPITLGLDRPEILGVPEHRLPARRSPRRPVQGLDRRRHRVCHRRRRAGVNAGTGLAPKR